MNSSIVHEIWIIVQNDLGCDVIQLLLALLILAFLVVTDGRQCSSMADDFWDSTILRQICTLSLLCQELILILEPCHFQKSLAVVADYMISNLDLLCQLRVFDTDKVVTPYHLLLAVEEESLTGLNLD